MAKIVGTIGLLLVALCDAKSGSCGCYQGSCKGSGCPRKLMVVNAHTIHSMDASLPNPEAFCVSFPANRDGDGRFTAVGDKASVMKSCEDADIVDAQEGVVLPGIIDSHGHIVAEGQRMSVADLASARNVTEAVEALKAYVKSHAPKPNAFVIGFGWDQNRWPGAVLPRRQDLDEAFPTIPVFLNRIDGHAAWVNTLALQKAGITRSTQDPLGGKIEKDSEGNPTGILTDNARALVARKIPTPSEEDCSSWLLAALKECASRGLTGLNDMGQDPQIIELFQKAEDEGWLSMRVRTFRLGADEAELGVAGKPTDKKVIRPDGRLTVRGVKFFMDGALGSWGAAMIQNYSDRVSRGDLRYQSEQAFRAAIRPWASAGWQVATHAIGDRANRVVLDAYEGLLSELNMTRADHRFRIEHAQVLEREDIPRFEALGVLPSVQPDFVLSDMSFAEKRLGPERLQGAYAFKRLLDTGLKALPFGSDFPTAGVVNPWWGIYAAISRKGLDGNPQGGWMPHEKVGRYQTLKGYTLDAAFSSFSETQVGSISLGKLADFVIIDRDIMSVEENQIWGTEVLATYTGGHEVYRKGAGESAQNGSSVAFAALENLGGSLGVPAAPSTAGEMFVV